MRRRVVLPVVLAALLVAGCGLRLDPGSPTAQRSLEPAPDGAVLEPARGEAAGEPWAFGVYRSGADACTYTVSGEVEQGSACGPMPADGLFGPFGAGGDLVAGWTYVGGVVGPRVASVGVVLEGAGSVEVAPTSIDEIGLDGAAFFLPLEPGLVPEAVVALDAEGVELERVAIGPLDDPMPPS